jgi:Arm DNA-binding domain
LRHWVVLNAKRVEILDGDSGVALSSRYWRHKYRFNGKEKRLTYGVYPEASLKEARSKRDASRKLLADGIDPSAVKTAPKNMGML